MDAPRRRALVIGLLLILYMVGSGVVDFVLRGPHAGPLFLAALLGILTESFWLGIAIIAYPILRPRTPILASLFVALGALILVLGIVENLGGAEWAHLVVRIVHGAEMFVFYCALYRFRYTPRVLAGAGLVASLLQIGALARQFFGGEVIFQLLAPTGVCQLILAIWLIAKGFDLRATGPVVGGAAVG